MQYERVLAIDPFYRGFGFALLEQPDLLVDWGLKSNRDQTSYTLLKQVKDIMNHYEPEVLVLERKARRTQKTQDFLTSIATIAYDRGMEVVPFTRREVKSVMGCTTQDEIAQTIVENHFPELAYRMPLPRKRKRQGGITPYPEDARINIFDAVSLAMTYYDRSSR